MPAHYPLEIVKQYVADALKNSNSEKVVFSAKSKSTNAVIEAFKTRGKLMTQDQARSYILNHLNDLSPSDFYGKHAGQWGDPKLIVDKYGIRRDGIPWFIKFYIEQKSPEVPEEYLDSISFHPSTEDMKLENKTTIVKDWEKV